ncbi:CRISPR-associated protein Csx16 [Luteithermobacter gelatinilyticus]|uniref:CRISPR-associated protein Csx16 n=1 Tax=Luteithermobacter gelatinilyticus TaxID=2582913 RepID=UPI001105767F|nr:CRISPR-associated protein Csx16 [Luteithermobacter gelatinilyticus]
MTKKGGHKIWFISRHPGAWEWFQAVGNQHEWTVTHRVEHLDPQDVSEGDVVLGTLPLHLAAAVCERGAEYWHLSLDLAVHQRGQELTYQDMVRSDGRLERYDVRKVKS